jgi:hypothetical protein
MHNDANGTTWPCPFCPPGTDYFERLSVNRTVVEFQCCGCTYKHREPANGRLAANPLPQLVSEFEDVGGFVVVSNAWLVAEPEVEGPPEEIGTGLYRLADGTVAGNEPEPAQY